MMKRISVLDVIVFLFAVLFLYAALNKIMTFDQFKAQLFKSPILMNHVWWVSWFIPMIEIVITLALLIPRFQLVALYASFSLMFMFSGYIFLILNFSPYVPCSCGGILSSLGWTEHLFFNIGFTLLGVVGILLHNRQGRLGRPVVAN